MHSVTVKEKPLNLQKPTGFFVNNLAEIEKRIIRAVANSKKGVIFDFDGVLADNYGLRARIYQRALSKHGFHIHIDDVRKMYCGMGGREIFERIVHKSGKDGEIIGLLKQDAYLEIDGRVRDVKLSRLHHKITHFLQEKGVQRGIATNCHGGWDKVVYNLRLREFYKFILSANDYEPKPSPQMLNAMLELMKLKPSEAVFIGDRQTDEEAGKAAGIETYRVRWAYKLRTP